MSIYQDKFTVLIQGPVNQSSYQNIDNYLKYGKVVISYWNNEGCFTKKPPKLANVSAYGYPLPDINKTVGALKDSTFYYAICSMYNGLKHVDTEYVVKTRSDEFYEDLTPFIDKFLENEENIVCGNIFVRKDIAYHIGDHIFVCKTQTILNAVTMLKNFYEQKVDESSGVPKIIRCPYWAIQKNSCAEVILAKAILKAKKVKMNKDWKDIFVENFYVVDINLTKRFLACWQHAGKKYSNQFINQHGVQCMEDFINGCGS